MLSGFAEQWECPSGEWLVWSPDPATRTAMMHAPDCGVRTSYIQEDHLRSGARGPEQARRLVFTSFNIYKHFDAQIMARVFTDFVRAHTSFHSAFPVSHDRHPVGRTLRPEQISLVLSARSSDSPSTTVKEYLMESLPALCEWSAFAFAVNRIENAQPNVVEPRFQVVVAADHMFTDGISQAISFFEILSRYTAGCEGQEYMPVATRPYSEFCAEQRARGDALTSTHRDVQQWRDVLRCAGGMPKFPLPLGLKPGESAPGAMLVHTSFVDNERATRFGTAAEHAGANINSALLAVLGQANYAITGNPVFTMLIPRADRSTPSDTMSVGWFVTLVPVQFIASGEFVEVAPRAHAAVKTAKRLDSVPVFPVIDVLSNDPEFPVEHGFAAPMLSYVDLTRIPGAELARHHELSVFANATPAEEVFMWINRDENGMDFNAMFPDTDVAASSVETLYRDLRERIKSISN